MAFKTFFILLLCFNKLIAFVEENNKDGVKVAIVKEQILKKILENFDLKEPLKNVTVPEKIEKMFMVKNLENDNNEYDMIPPSTIDISPMNASLPHLRFKNPYILRENTFQSVILKLKINKKKILSNDKVINGKIYLLTNSNEFSEAVGDIHFNDDILLKELIEIPLNEILIKRIINEGVEDISFYIKLDNYDEPLLNIIDYTTLVINTKRKKIRTKRSEQTSRCKTKVDGCCKRNLRINFDNIGWNFIVSPKEIVANYCEGKCHPYGVYTSIGSALYALHNSNLFDHKSCCFPSVFNDLNISIFREGSIVETKVIKDILVKKCDCY
uniref:TGF_BETA_2 domain-containing protein n=1 Tax=Parastrongyloides trichosuri TaxID=131310 RepID=A0A0N4ZI53_PARTI